MLKYVNFVSLFLFLLISLGCSKKEDPATPETKEIFPLKIGNKWNFLTVRNDSTKANHVNEVIKDTLINGQSWYILTYDTTIPTVCRNTPDGWWFLYYTNPDLPGKPTLYYRYPTQLNYQYMTIDSSLVTVESIDEKVTVAAGTFTCYHYHMIHYRESYECEEFFAPGKGFIKHIVYEAGSGTSKILETTTLISYKLYGK